MDSLIVQVNKRFPHTKKQFEFAHKKFGYTKRDGAWFQGIGKFRIPTGSFIDVIKFFVEKYNINYEKQGFQILRYDYRQILWRNRKRWMWLFGKKMLEFEVCRKDNALYITVFSVENGLFPDITPEMLINGKYSVKYNL